MKALVDGDLIRQVVWNLVRNAAEAYAGGLQPDHHHAVTRGLRQTGCENSRRWTQASPRSSSLRSLIRFTPPKKSGSGLGLAIAHSIIEAHGGELNVDSELGRGTEISLHLPGIESPVPSVRPSMATAEE